MHQQNCLPGNIRDGQKINERTFKTEQDANICEQAKHTASLLNDHNYGLLPSLENEGGIELFLSIDSLNQVQVRLQKCHAITRGGYFIGFDTNTVLYGSNFKAVLSDISVPCQELKERSSSYYIVITVDPYNRVPHGLANPLEQPARIPYTAPAYYLSLIPARDATENLLGLFQLPVGKFEIQEQKAVLDEDYIPPCRVINSHKKLALIHARIEDFYTKFEEISIKIIQKILIKKQGNELTGIMQKLCENITSLTASHLAQLKTLSLNKPPVELICMLSSLARTIKNTLDYYPDKSKEELLNYFTKWCEVSPGELESTITALSNHQYNHIDLSSSFQKASVFTNIMLKLFYNLERLDLKVPNNDFAIVIGEKVITEPIKKRFYFSR